MKQRLIINASHKKTATSLLHDFFRDNVSLFDGLAVPPIKEWYTIPKVPPWTPRGEGNLSEQYLLGERAEALFLDKNLEFHGRDKEFLRRVANRPAGFYITRDEILERLCYLLEPYEDKTVIINDPNFLLHATWASVHLKGSVISTLLSKFDIQFFIIHRDFGAIQASLLKMIFANTGKLGIPRKLSELVAPLLFLNEEIGGTIEKPVPVLNFELLKASPDTFFVTLCNLLWGSSLEDIEFSIPENPNPASDIDYSPIAGEIEAQRKLCAPFKSLMMDDVAWTPLCDFSRRLSSIIAVLKSEPMAGQS